MDIQEWDIQLLYFHVTANNLPFLLIKFDLIDKTNVDVLNDAKVTNNNLHEHIKYNNDFKTTYSTKYVTVQKQQFCH